MSNSYKKERGTVGLGRTSQILGKLTFTKKGGKWEEGVRRNRKTLIAKRREPSVPHTFVI